MPKPHRSGRWQAALAALALLVGASATAQDDAADTAYSRKGADTCLSCHEDATTLALFKSKHAVPGDSRGPFGHGQLQCEACHGPGDAHAGRVRRGQERPPMIDFGSDTITGIDTQNDTCLACHSGDAGAGWHAGPHDNGEVACADCHTSHAARDAVLETATQAEVCYDCHPAQRGEMLRAFAHPLLEGKMACSDCHQGHGDAAALQLAQLAPNATCNECHADKRGPFLWEHAPASEDCGLCHAPHGSNHPGLLTRRAPLLCQSCHSQAGHPSIAADSGGLPNAMPSRFLLGQSCLNCHSQVHGSNHPSGSKLAR